MNKENLALQQGDIEDLKKASADGVKIVILKKSFSGKIIDHINLVDSLIAKSTFDSAKIYASSFTRCEFSKDDFSKSDLSIIEFTDCVFFKVNFSDSTIKDVKFTNCKFTECTFNNVDLSNNVFGLSQDDVNVISEQTDEQVQIFMDAGFVRVEDEGSDLPTFKYEFDENSYAVIYHDPEMNDEIWRMSAFVNGECKLTQDFILDDELTVEKLTNMLQYEQKTVSKIIQLNKN